MYVFSGGINGKTRENILINFAKSSSSESENISKDGLFVSQRKETSYFFGRKILNDVLRNIPPR